jgi:uncharacterized membrane protein YhaH (DUF805 family)
MGFVEAVRTCLLRKFWDFGGRASRAEYWWFVLFNVLVTIPFALLGPLLFVAGIVLLLPQLAVGVRRLHDTNRSGWWLALSALGWIPFVGWIASLGLVWLLIQKGDGGVNRYGPNPLGAVVPGVGGPPPPPPPSYG